MTRKEIKEKYGYKFVDEFREGRAVVVNNNRDWGHVDGDGNIITPMIFTMTGDFFYGEAYVKLNNVRGHVNLNGNIIDNHEEFIREVFNE